MFETIIYKAREFGHLFFKSLLMKNLVCKINTNFIVIRIVNFKYKNNDFSAIKCRSHVLSFSQSIFLFQKHKKPPSCEI